jgi:hypothetical protein
VHGAALGDVVGDRVPELSVAIVWVKEGAGGPLALSGGRVGFQGPADDQAAGRQGLDAEQVAAGQRPARLPGLDVVVIAVAMIRSPRLAWMPSAIVTARPPETMPRPIKSH